MTIATMTRCFKSREVFLVGAAPLGRGIVLVVGTGGSTRSDYYTRTMSQPSLVLHMSFTS
jgi:hypothetical protein